MGSATFLTFGRRFETFGHVVLSPLLLSVLLLSVLFSCVGVTTASITFVLYFGGLVGLFWNELQTHICFWFVSPSCLCVTSYTIVT